MILGKNTKRREMYINSCPTKEDFLEILSLDKCNPRSFDSSQREEYSIFTQTDSLDFTIYYIFYPLPLVKEVVIKNWAGGWESDRSLLHLEFYEGEWKMRKVMKYDNPKRVEETIKNINKENIFPEISSFIENIDKEMSKLLNRRYNISQLV